MPVEPCFIEGASNADLDRGATPEYVSDLWRYAKANYSDQGISFPEALPKLAADLKMSQRQLSYVMNKPKMVKNVAADLAQLQKQRMRFLADNRQYLNNVSRSDVSKVMELANSAVRGTLLAAHGPVIGTIHPIDIAFTAGEQWKYLRMYGRAFASFSEAQTKAVMDNLATKDRYQMWQDVGLPIGPTDTQLGIKMNSWSGRAMEAALKPLMYEKAEQLRDGTPPEWQNDKTVLKDIAQQAANAVGAVAKGQMGYGPFTSAVNAASLAAQLNFSRWWKTYIDPAKTIATYTQAALHHASKLLPDKEVGGVSLRRPPPTPEARVAASNRLWSAGKWLAGIVGGLALNDQLSRAIGSSARVNFTDPKRSDYFAFRVNIPVLGEYYIKTRGSMEPLQLLARMIGASTPYAKPKYGATTPEEVFGRYTEYKLTPSISLAKELATGRDVFGRPVPWSPAQGTKFAPKYTYPEYFGQHAPIFIGHGVQAFYEGMREAGVTTDSIRSIFQGIQQHPEILARAGAEGAGEFLGINMQRERGKPYQTPAWNQ